LGGKQTKGEEHMKEIIIRPPNKESITIYVTDTELKIAKNLGLSERQYIEQKVKMTLDEELKEKNP
jgi:hypothetical protein